MLHAAFLAVLVSLCEAYTVCGSRRYGTLGGVGFALAVVGSSLMLNGFGVVLFGLVFGRTSCGRSAGSGFSQRSS